MLSRASRRLCFLSWVAGGLLGLFITGEVNAGDCGCGRHREVMPLEMGCHHCDCSPAGGMSWFDGIHFLHSRAKKLFDLRFRLSHRLLPHKRVCDDACDAALLEDLMAPEDALIHGLGDMGDPSDSPEDSNSSYVPLPISHPVSPDQQAELEVSAVIPPEADLRLGLFDPRSDSREASERPAKDSEDLPYFDSDER